jgi:hypothetical protein
LGSAAAAGARDDPQRGQKAKSGSQTKPQLAQATGCRRPQRGQKAKSANISKPQPTQVIGRLIKPCRTKFTLAQTERSTAIRPLQAAFTE